MKVIVIEGADCVGKTTLAKHLLDKMVSRGYRAEILNRSENSNDRDNCSDINYYKKVNGYLLHKRTEGYLDYLILDRWVLTELVYSKVRNYPVRFNIDEFLQFNAIVDYTIYVKEPEELHEWDKRLCSKYKKLSDALCARSWFDIYLKYFDVVDLDTFFNLEGGLK